jgi:hypothetical protein
MQNAISFSGTIVDGIGKYTELRVPGRNEVRQAPKDWPVRLCPGSLNLRILPSGYPELFSANGLPNTTKSLDSRIFAACFAIPQSEFGNNRIVPTPQLLHRGSAQVWRSKLEYGENQISCWVLRRFGSGLADQIEILSKQHLRTEYGIESGNAATITLFS